MFRAQRFTFFFSDLAKAYTDVFFMLLRFSVLRWLQLCLKEWCWVVIWLEVVNVEMWTVQWSVLRRDPDRRVVSHHGWSGIQLFEYSCHQLLCNCPDFVLNRWHCFESHCTCRLFFFSFSFECTTCSVGSNLSWHQFCGQVLFRMQTGQFGSATVYYFPPIILPLYKSFFF